MHSTSEQIAPVRRTRDQARANYDRLAPWYDRLASRFEAPHRRQMVEMLDVRCGESVLDVGFGTGDVVCELARVVGAAGAVAGVDLSANMKRVTTHKLRGRGLLERTDLRVGDACLLPFGDGKFDAVCSSFTLELFTVDEMQTVLGECRRVLDDDGRLAVASLSTHERTAMARLYELARRWFPAALDCRPIPVEKVLQQRHFDVVEATHSRMAGIPVAVVVGAAVVG